MRKVLLTLATFVALAGLFTGSWFVTGMLRGTDGAPDLAGSEGTLPGDTSATGNETASSSNATVPVQGELSLPYPKDLAELDRHLLPVLSRFGANAIAASRIFTYASVAWYEASATEGSPTFISGSAGEQGPEQAPLAAGAVISALLDNAQVTELVDAWPGEISTEAATVAANVVAFAQADGYDATEDASAPTFEGPLAWQPGGKRDGRPAGYEPGYGQVRTVKLDSDACPVEAADIAAIDAERAALADIDRDVPAPVIARPERFAVLAYIYIANHLEPEQRAQMPLLGQTGIVMFHDALISTWRANWANGVASPIDLLANGDTSIMGNYPSYPSWTAVAVSATETFVNAVTGTDADISEILDYVAARPLVSKEYGGLLKELRKDIENATSTTHHWRADVSAGRALGACIATQALQVLGK